jgi:hypothetical protein
LELYIINKKIVTKILEESFKQKATIRMKLIEDNEQLVYMAYRIKILANIVLMVEESDISWSIQPFQL